MPQMMQAAAVEAFGDSLTLREWPVPTAGPGQIVKAGNGVGVPWMYSACGHCEYRSRVVLDFGSRP